MTSSPSPGPPVRAGGLVKRFESTLAIDHVDLEVHASEIRGLLGPNGPDPYLSARANLELLARLDGRGARRRIDDVLERVDLAGRARDRVGGYSTGLRQRLGIAAALLRQPRLMLLDEPTGGLDPAGVREVGALLRELSAEGVAILLSSHLIGEIEGTCDGFTVLSHEPGAPKRPELRPPETPTLTHA